MTLIEGKLTFFLRLSPLNQLFYRIAAVPSFSGLRRFPQGRHFKQWTGDDSKALMKVCCYKTLAFLRLDY